MTRELTDSIEMAINTIEKNNKNPKRYYQLYPFTTENIAGYINEFNLKNKSLLTVGSSCDQSFNAILNGSKDINILDINPYVKYYYYLKKSALLTFDKDKYLEFLSSSENSLDKELFYKLKSTLREIDFSSYLFWDELLNNYSSEKVRNNLFYKPEYNKEQLCYFNQYLQNEVAYDLLKYKIKSVDPLFITNSIKNYYTSAKYDNIWLSNICSEYTKETVDKLLNKYMKYLNKKGQLLLSYIYLLDEDKIKDNITYNIESNDKYNVNKLSFESVEKDKSDAVVLCRKK